MKTVTTKKGTQLQLMQLKGKDYMQVAFRLQWFVEENARYSINTNYLLLNSMEAIAKVTINIFDDKGQLIKTAEGTKRETQKDFADYAEKAETGALGRALVQLGYGTQYALADLDEGTRIVDSPIVNASGPSNLEVKVTSGLGTGDVVPTTTTVTSETKPRASFRKPKSEPKLEKPTNGSSTEEDFFS